MEKTNLLTLVVTLTVGIILAGSLLMPVLSDATKTTETFTNEGYYTMDKVAADADFTLTWDYTEPTYIDIGGEKIDLSDRGLINGMNYTIFGADNFVLRYRALASPMVQYYGDASISPSFMAADIPSASTMTVTVANGTITFQTTNPSYIDPVTIPLKDTAYCINAKDAGAYVMKKSNDSAYIESNTDIIVLDGITTLAANDVGIYADGTINGALEATVFRGTGTYGVTFSNWTYDTVDVGGYEDLVKLEKVVFTATQNNTDYTVTYSYYIVPVEVTAELSAHLNSGEIALLNALPILIIVGLVMVGAGAIVIKNRD